ncbi:phosphate-starvation-inducible PsiE family protein [Effusibacillus lacus]|uniref:Transporter n=1 Tax=Effusibacillus lacus TaxID=1348429 RepID=A0A292YCI2_9BACL|nr:hypothetical protein [Effusibacillus lacus]TCS69394.1 hypothetical protein EDD64_13721 [Effusibacillus lacus]GAX89162.1 hypothetical protein EFBL_0780 [Effusibacillus lacus]
MKKSVEKAYQIAELIIRVFEIGLSFFIVIGIFVEGILHAKRLWKVTYEGELQSFQIFLDNVLLYIIGLEVAMMFVKREPNIMVDILIFAIARKMIIDTSKGIDFLFGAFAILILYIVKCYGIRCILLPGYFRRAANSPDSNPHSSDAQSSG